MKQSTHETSISAWAKTLEHTRHRAFASKIMQEEQAKLARLDQLSSTIGLPVYQTRRFLLPLQAKAYGAYCKKLTATRVWNLALRFSEPASPTAIHRLLGATCPEAIAAGKDLARSTPCYVAVTPYREPDQSGTFIARPGLAYLEYVRGPHFWITKPGEAGGPLRSCELTFPQVLVAYSTTDPSDRSLLFRSFQYCVQLLVGCTIRELRYREQFVYAEFHWHQDRGPLFIECSFAESWAGPAAADEVRDGRMKR